MTNNYSLPLLSLHIFFNTITCVTFVHFFKKLHERKKKMPSNLASTKSPDIKFTTARNKEEILSFSPHYKNAALNSCVATNPTWRGGAKTRRLFSPPTSPRFLNGGAKETVTRGPAKTENACEKVGSIVKVHDGWLFRLFNTWLGLNKHLVCVLFYLRNWSIGRRGLPVGGFA